jgi:flavin reductase (DIM6/NTAB) family NADH-FMN oxidoreductase RutF
MSDATESGLPQILGQIPSGLYILTARHEGQETGMLASWVMQAGFSPPMISIALRSDRYLAGWLAAGAPFVLNVLGDSPKALLRHFGRGFEPGEPAFENVAVGRCPRGVPVLEDTIGHLQCRPITSSPAAEHTIFIAEVTGGQHIAGRAPFVHIRHNGLRY